MRILHVTDFHFSPPWFRWLKAEARRYDCTVFSGDFLDLFSAPPDGATLDEQSNWVRDFLVEYPAPIFACGGNHDGDAVFLQDAAAKNPSLRIDGTDEVFGGYRFVCVGWENPPAVIEPAPDPLILVSHAPPANCDVSLGEFGDVGSEQVAHLVDLLPLGSLVLSGHVHEPTRWFVDRGGVICINPGAKIEAEYPNHIVIDTRRRRCLLLSTEERHFESLCQW